MNRIRVAAILLSLLALTGCGRDGAYAFIIVDEANSHALEAAPADDLRLSEYSANFTTGALVVSRRSLVPGRTTHAIVAHHARGRGVTLAQRVFPVSRFPWTLRLTEPLRLEGEVRDLQGVSLGVRNVVNNEERLAPFDLVFLGLDAGGTVRFLAGEEEVTLGPGESWLVAFVAEAGGVRCVRWGADWEVVIRAAIDRDIPVTRLEVLNHGMWDKQQVRVGSR